MNILYFAWVRERVGVGEEVLAPPSSVKTLGDLLDWLGTQSPAHETALSERNRLRFAIDQEYAEPTASIEGAREVAIFPPVTGG